VQGTKVAVATVLALALVAGACTSDSATTASEPPSVPPSTVALPAGDDASVVRVVDGDTVVVRLAGRDTTVRLIGIDTPETKDPREAVQCFGREASARAGALLPVGAQVRLAYDVERNDRYGRTLAYVYAVGDPPGDHPPGRGVFVNAALVRDGFASAYTYPPNVAHSDELVALQREASDAGRGLWRECPAPEGTALRRDSGPKPGASGGGCDPAYPDGCIPPAPPDLDCADVTARGFRVLAPDPHRFDSNGDGVGCEGAPS
jgi:micrococcal nuclease